MSFANWERKPEREVWVDYANEPVGYTKYKLVMNYDKPATDLGTYVLLMTIWDCIIVAYKRTFSLWNASNLELQSKLFFKF